MLSPCFAFAHSAGQIVMFGCNAIYLTLCRSTPQVVEMAQGNWHDDDDDDDEYRAVVFLLLVVVVLLSWRVQIV